jgi:hypothetical protein
MKILLCEVKLQQQQQQQQQQERKIENLQKSAWINIT